MIDISKYGIHKVKLPMPFRLADINCYAIKGKDGWSLVDTGLNYEPSRQAWLKFMDNHGVKVEDIMGIYVTHYHPDHYGGAGWLQQLSGAPVYMSAIESSKPDKVWNSDQHDPMIYAMFLENGMPSEIILKIRESRLDMRDYVSPHPNITILTEKEVCLGDRYYQVISTPGHTDGHISFYNEESGILFSGDYLLANITSNISQWPYNQLNPLGKFLNSLKESRHLKVSWVLPAHGEFFNNVEDRISELEEHHRVRLGLMKQIALQGATAYEVCKEIFGNKLSIHDVSFAIAETLAHLIYLKKTGELQVDKIDGVYVYSA